MAAYCCQDGAPVEHSHQLLNHIVDCHAARRPQTLFAEYPKSIDSYEQGFMKVTYGMLANAIDRIAWWLVDNLGTSQDFASLAYIGLNDLVYPSLMLGAVKAGFKTLLLSPRNSIEAQLHLLNATRCKVFIVAEPCPPPVAMLLKSLDKDQVQILKVPTINELLQPGHKKYAYNMSYEAAKHAPFTVLHTSGTTGLPKPITIPQSFICAYAKQLRLLPPVGYKSVDQLYQGNRIFTLAPPFHSAYIILLVNSITNCTANIFPVKGAIPSVDSISQALKYTKLDVAMAVPQMIEEMSRSPQTLREICSQIDALIYGGGDLPQSCGDAVAAQVPLLTCWGSTESGNLSLVYSERENISQDWKYLHFHPKVGAELRYHSDDKYELWIVRSPQLEQYQAVFTIFPELQEYRTRDLFRRHPTDTEKWTHCGRTDETVVLLNGEKFAPVDTEQYVASENPEISGVIMAGAKRFQPVLLVELARNELWKLPTADLIDRFWPSIEGANEVLPSHAQIARSHILFIDPSRPMVRTPKSTILRSETLTLYASDIDILYTDADRLIDTTATVCDIQDTQSTNHHLKAILAQWTEQTIGDDDNFFLHGITSLQTLLLVREMRRKISSMPQVDIRFIYTYPTVKSLVAALQRIAGSNAISAHSEMRVGVEDITSMLAQYTKLINKITNRPTYPKRSESAAPVYLLTGSTGSLGSYLLQSLLGLNGSQIYCLNRTANGAEVQRRRYLQRDPEMNIPDARVTFLVGDMSLPFFGLDPIQYEALSKSVTHIIHNAWTVNFNVPLSFYDSQIQGLVNLVNFLTTASLEPNLLYISSIGAVAGSKTEPIPEIVIEDHTIALSTGYGASKYVSEHLLDYAAHRFKLDIKVARVGQIAGSITGKGEWNRTEWLPSLITSSARIKAVPSSLGAQLDSVDWIPIDVLATVLLELLQCDEAEAKVTTGRGARVFNVVNSQTRRWNELLPVAIRGLSRPAENDRATTTAGPSSTEVVSFEDWIQKVGDSFQEDLRAAGDSSVSVEVLLRKNPAAKLLQFYQDANTATAKRWETAQACAASPALRSLGPVDESWLGKWLDEWMAD